LDEGAKGGAGFWSGLAVVCFLLIWVLALFLAFGPWTSFPLLTR
jgi:hypothetical protein